MTWQSRGFLQEEQIRAKELAIIQIQREVEEREEETRRLQQEVDEARRREEEAALAAAQMATPAYQHVEEYDHGDDNTEDGMSNGNGACTSKENFDYRHM